MSHAPGDPRFVDAAEALASRLCEDARWTGRSASWLVPKTASATSERVLADGWLHNGSAGIALFLLRVHAHRPAAALVRTAAGALRHAVALARRQPCMGYHAGAAGVADACIAMAAADGDRRWLQRAEALARRAIAPGKLDVMNGEAGSILGWLRVHDATRAEAYLAVARRLGAVVVARRRVEAEGVSWDVSRPAVHRNLLGLSHGAGGIALALLELFRHTGDTPLIDCALEALRYEDACFDHRAGNWPDYRHVALSRYLGTAAGTLERDLAAGRYRTSRPGDLAAWCHGAPGVGLVRARFARVLGLAGFRDGLERAARRTLQAIRRPGVDHSLCHGVAGHITALVHIGRALGSQPIVDEARRVACELAATLLQTGRSISGNVQHAENPSLMLGDAGVGLCLLQLAEDSLESPLLPVTTLGARGELGAVDRRGATARVGLAHFAGTARALVRARVGLPTVARSYAALAQELDRRARSIAGAAGAAAQRVLALEHARYRAICRPRDIGDELVRRLERRAAWPALDDTTAIGLSHDAAVLCAGPTRYLIVHGDPDHAIRPLDRITATLCDVASQPTSIAAVEAALCARAGTTPAFARAVMTAAFEAGVIAPRA